MPQPNRKYEDEAGDLQLPGDDESQEIGDSEERPDWLLSAEQPVDAFQPEESPTASGPVLRRPGSGAVVPPEPGAPRPRVAPAPTSPAGHETARLDGLLGPEPPSDQPSILSGRLEQMGMHAASAREAPPMMPTWAAAASSIPTLRAAEPADEAEVEVVAADDDEWDGPNEEPKTAAPRTPSPVKLAPELALPFPVPEPFAGPLRAALQVVAPILGNHGRLIAGVAAGLVVLLIVLKFALPKEHVTSVRDVIRDAASLDGKEVRIRGVIGQWFPMGEGYSFYLHQGRDTIVVFTRARTPTEKQKVKVLGTVSTGYLDGRPRPTIFETRLD